MPSSRKLPELPPVASHKFNVQKFVPFQKGLHESANLLGWSVDLFRSQALTLEEVRDLALEDDEDVDQKHDVDGELTPQKQQSLVELTAALEALLKEQPGVDDEGRRTFLKSVSDLTLSIRKEAETPHQVMTTTKKVMSTSVKKKNCETEGGGVSVDGSL